MITINGKTYRSGKSISVIGNKVIIDGVVVEEGDDVKAALTIRIEGDDPVEVTSDRTINCGNVNGDVNAGGSVNCDSVVGSVHAGGSVNCNSVGGNVYARGSVNL